MARGKTIAVLGSGINNIFPEENISLAEEIVKKGGLIISEYEPNTFAKSTNFPKRNRIVSGLSMGVLVVEAHERSGTTITAGLAKKQGRKVFAIPNIIDNKYGIITNDLIKKGAILTRNVEDIVNEFGLNKRKSRKQIIENVQVPGEYKAVYEILSNGKMHIDEIAKRLNVQINSLNATLTLMELEGYVNRLPGKFYIRK